MVNSSHFRCFRDGAKSRAAGVLSAANAPFEVAAFVLQQLRLKNIPVPAFTVQHAHSVEAVVDGHGIIACGGELVACGERAVQEELRQHLRPRDCYVPDSKNHHRQYYGCVSIYAVMRVYRVYSNLS
eukprot:COSAG05_NODE_3952_length_1754_cov_1.475529_1_plen_126_part_10